MFLNKFDPEWYQRRFSLFAEGDGAEGGGDAGKTVDAASADAGKAPDAGKDEGKADDAGKAAPDWRTGVQDEKLREHASRFTSLDDLVKANLDSRQKLSTALIPPGKDAKPEEIAEYRKKTGVPDAPAGYVFEDPDGYQPTDSDKAMRAKFAETFHAHNLPAETAKALTAAYRDIFTNQVASMKAADEAYARESEAALRKEWPGAEYDTNKAYAERGAKQMLGADYEAARLIEDKAGRFVLDNPVMLKMLAKIGRESSEGGLGGVVSESQRDTIQGQIDSLRKSIAEAQNSGDSRKANELYQREQNLIAQLQGNKAIVGSQGRAA